MVKPEVARIIREGEIARLRSIDPFYQRLTDDGTPGGAFELVHDGSITPLTVFVDGGASGRLIYELRIHVQNGAALDPGALFNETTGITNGITVDLFNAATGAVAVNFTPQAIRVNADFSALFDPMVGFIGNNELEDFSLNFEEKLGGALHLKTTMSLRVTVADDLTNTPGMVTCFATAFGEELAAV
jgi:hypothetical protein